MPLHLDTGANQTTLSARYAAANPAAVAGLQVSERRSASAGGTRSAQVATWRNAPIGLAGRTLVLPSLPVNLPADGPNATILTARSARTRCGHSESYTIDFATMRLELGEPVGHREPGGGERREGKLTALHD